MSPELYLLLSLLARLSGFFLLSPFFSRGGLPLWARFGVALTCSLLLAPPLQAEVSIQKNFSPFALTLELLQEGAIGYTFGLLFSLLFEAVACAGELLGSLSGFSASVLLDPLFQIRSPLLSQLFTLLLFTLFFALDLHHPLLRFLYFSFHTSFRDLTWGLMEGVVLLFQYAVTYALFPLTLLLLLLFGTALLGRYLPTLQVFWVGLPLQLLVGTYVLISTVGWFNQIMHRAYYALWLLAKKMFFSL